MTSSRQDALSAAATAAVDASGLCGDILAMPDHVEDAQWRAESAMLRPFEATGLVVCGMGGSAIGADLAVACLGSEIGRPVHVIRGYDLPAWVSPDYAVVCSSYSGNTEETLSCYEQAVERGAAVYVVSSGGRLSELAHAGGVPVIGLPGILQPRASVAYGVVSTLEIAIATGIVDPSVRIRLNAAAALLRELTNQWGPDGASDAAPKRLAREAHDRLTIVYGAQLTAPVAYRWRCQINENAKLPAISAELPEANHNEICGWAETKLTPKVAWLLRDAGQHERVKMRIELTARVAERSGANVEIVDAIGESPFERMFSSVLLGDLASLYMAVLRGVDPSPVDVIESLKEGLGRPSRA